VVQASAPAADDEPVDVGDVAADAALAEPWLPHPVITSPHAAAARALIVAGRRRAAARVSPRRAADRALGSLPA
jgi:hypothetical protein